MFILATLSCKIVTIGGGILSFGERVKLLRRELNLTQEGLAKKLNSSRSTIAGYETEGKQPDYDTLKFIANFFNVSIDYLLGETDIRQPAIDIIKDQKKTDSALDEISEEIRNLSPESQEELKKLIDLYKFKDMHKRNDDVETANDLTSTE